MRSVLAGIRICRLTGSRITACNGLERDRDHNYLYSESMGELNLKVGKPRNPAEVSNRMVWSSSGRTEEEPKQTRTWAKESEPPKSFLG